MTIHWTWISIATRAYLFHSVFPNYFPSVTERPTAIDRAHLDVYLLCVVGIHDGDQENQGGVGIRTLRRVQR